METKQLQVEYAAIDSLVPYVNNANIHSEEQIEQIMASIKEFGFNDPIGVWTNADGETEIVEGHGRVMAAKKLGYSVLPVIHLDSLTDEQRRAYTHVHNQQTRNSEFDWEMLAEEMDALAFDWDELGFDILVEDDHTDDTYTDKTESFIYEPSDEVPELSELADFDKQNELERKAAEYYEDGRITEEQYLFLVEASKRHTVFDYGKIADYYASADADMKELMEDSALVIIDYNKAIEEGYVKLRDSIALLMEEEIAIR